MEKPMLMAIKEAQKTSRVGIGGPFGAAIVDNITGEVICVECNQVLQNNDPTAHAEIMAIRKACQILGTYDLSGHTIYATGYPCPMCMSAIIWANIDKLVYGGKPEDAAKIGFRDDFIYEFIKSDCNNTKVLRIEHSPYAREEVKKLYSKYSNRGVIY